MAASPSPLGEGEMELRAISDSENMEIIQNKLNSIIKKKICQKM